MHLVREQLLDLLFEPPDSREFNSLLLLLVEDLALEQTPEHLEDEDGLSVLLADQDLLEGVEILLRI
jgi:hypothetical protein